MIGGLPTLAVAELGTTREAAAIVGTIIPLLENFVGLLLVLHDHETSVEEQVAPSVAVVLGVGVERQSHGVVLGGDAPVVHEPLEREIEAVEEGVRVNEDTDVMLLEDLCEDRGLLPGIATVGVAVDLDVVVLVSVDLGYLRVSRCTQD